MSSPSSTASPRRSSTSPSRGCRRSRGNAARPWPLPTRSASSTATSSPRTSSSAPTVDVRSRSSTLGPAALSRTTSRRTSNPGRIVRPRLFWACPTGPRSTCGRWAASSPSCGPAASSSRTTPSPPSSPASQASSDHSSEIGCDVGGTATATSPAISSSTRRPRRTSIHWCAFSPRRRHSSRDSTSRTRCSWTSSHSCCK
mmetsp:Transcript_40773/g.95245  ORF Transcript_40773/g.95245 Transcript_40773/m.95245 type:complete len:200 (+) Transcript_40773:833-1432(+)